MKARRDDEVANKLCGEIPRERDGALLTVYDNIEGQAILLVRGIGNGWAVAASRRFPLLSVLHVSSLLPRLQKVG